MLNNDTPVATYAIASQGSLPWDLDFDFALLNAANLVVTHFEPVVGEASQVSMILTQVTDYDVYFDTGSSGKGYIRVLDTVDNQDRQTTGGTIVLSRVTTPDQETNFEDADTLPVEAIEKALDKLTMLIQERGASSASSPSGLSVTFQDPIDGAVLVWDGVDGDITNGPTPTWLTSQVTAAQAAQTAAETAQSLAETAQGLAESAQSDAETAKAGAETAQGLAEAAQGLAESAESNAGVFADQAELWAEEDEDVEVTTGKYSSKHWAAKAAASANGFLPNRIINPTFAINQDVITLGSHSAGVYFRDQWKAGASGCTVSLSGITLTISAGSVIQPIEDVDIPNGTYTVSWEGTSTLSVDGGAAQTSPYTFTVSSGTHVDLEWGTGTLSEPLLTDGSTVKDFILPIKSIELLRCYRHYCKSYSESVAPGTASTDGAIVYITPLSSASVFVNVYFPAAMRSTPTLTIYSSESGASGYVRNLSASADQQVNNIYNTSHKWFGYLTLTSSSSAYYVLNFHYTANARL